ncbi:MAG: DEAD/DEAH box helicase family protein, partial [Oscillospiraceae bacterium]|nr:DEAD/DEAH box helicase family protein [Oscillospiraceae bacterium]
LKNKEYDRDTNIFTDIFTESIERINPTIKDLNTSAILNDIKDTLDYNDLGRSFYQKLTSAIGVRLIDFEDFDNNDFKVCTELVYKNGEDEFRPDITVLINGIPLVFIEVKKPNNHDGILAERRRMNVRFQNKKFRRFVNITQFMIFSNNMEYDSETVVPIQGAFYATPSQNEITFNCFREENQNIFSMLKDISEEAENKILSDNNLVAIKNSDEYITNKSELKPTNRIISSLLLKERLKMLLKYGIVYVDGSNGIQKHIMRYPQLFATLAIENKISDGIKKGIIWHTQGSGKTALAYFNVAYLTEFFRQKSIVPKFFFIVDRLDLMEQAKGEFSKRGLKVQTVNSKMEFKSIIKELSAIGNDSGQKEITVVNIQKFSEESKVTEQTDYNINIQRIYFLDEVHRSYNPRGSFLANLMSSDRNAIFLGLTGTPLINQKLKPTDKKGRIDFKSTDVFGDYIHKYYYNLSIEDGYTLRLIREGIETTYKAQCKEILKQIELLKGSATKTEIYAHTKYVSAMAEYVATDFKNSRIRLGDETIGGMIVCESSEQAKALFKVFETDYKDLKTALILHDVDDKQTRTNNREEFKLGNIDILIVYNMLLTGFDAHRLKRLYLHRVVKDHNLLQTLTRVNRPYKAFRYGFVVDFADIRYEFDKTNAAYFQELQDEIGEEWDTYSNLFKSAEEIQEEIADIEEQLFRFDTRNAEIFSEQINQIENKSEILDIKRALESAKILGNLIKLYGHEELANKLDFTKLNTLLIEVNNRLALINQRDTLENAEDNSNLINMAIEDIIFAFRKVSENELQLGLVDNFKDQIRKTREAMQNNFDHKDPEYISLYEELERIFKKKKLTEMTTDDIQTNLVLLHGIYDRITEQNRRDNLLRAKYENDVKYARVHKRLLEGNSQRNPKWREVQINTALLAIKQVADSILLTNHAVLNNESYFNKTLQPLVYQNFNKA